MSGFKSDFEKNLQDTLDEFQSDPLKMAAVNILFNLALTRGLDANAKWTLVMTEHLKSINKEVKLLREDVSALKSTLTLLGGGNDTRH